MLAVLISALIHLAKTVSKTLTERVSKQRRGLTYWLPQQMILGHLGAQISRKEQNGPPHCERSRFGHLEDWGEYLVLDIEDMRENSTQGWTWLCPETMVELAQEERKARRK